MIDYGQRKNITPIRSARKKGSPIIGMNAKRSLPARRGRNTNRLKAKTRRGDGWTRAPDYAVRHIAREPGIYFDAGTGGGNGVEINVTDSRGHSLLHRVLPENELSARGHHLLEGGRTNNYGELLACKYALMIALQDAAQKIFGDSKLIIDYWSKGYIKNDNNDSETIALVREVGKLRRQFEDRGGRIIRISGGANPADLGFHKP